MSDSDRPHDRGRRQKVLVAAAINALVALALMVWALVDSQPLAMIVSMSVGQALGTASFVLWAAVALYDIRVADRTRIPSIPPAPRAPPPEPGP